MKKYVMIVCRMRGLRGRYVALENVKNGANPFEKQQK